MHTHRMGNGAPDFELATDASSRRLPTRPLLARPPYCRRRPTRPRDCPHLAAALHICRSPSSTRFSEKVSFTPLPDDLRRRDKFEEGALNDDISRREFGMAAGAAGVGLITPSKSLAANESNAPPVNYSSGLIESPPTYYEVLAPVGGSTKPPMVLISGGAHTGACYLATVDGRPCWAHAFVRAGYKVVVPDWPGVGRSGYIPLDDLTGDVVVAGLGKIVAIAPGPPGNIQAVSEIASETADTVVVRGSTTMTINLKQAVVSDRNFVEVKLVGRSAQFPREYIAVYASSLSPIPPRLLYQRRNIRGSQLKVADLSNYRGKRILVMTGTADIDHPRDLDGAIVEWLNQNGAKADFLYLGDHGIEGNGHMMMLEKNSDALAGRILSWIENS